MYDATVNANTRAITREDNASAAFDAGFVTFIRRTDTLVSGAGAQDGDYINPRGDLFGSAWGALTADDGARIPATTADGLLVNLGTNNDVTIPVSGSGVFSIKDTAIAAASQNFSFGFTSQKVSIEAASTNSDDVCIDWIGGTAVCPAADTAGDYRLKPGVAILLDEYSVTSISAISASGTNEINILAVN